MHSVHPEIPCTKTKTNNGASFQKTLPKAETHWQKVPLILSASQDCVAIRYESFSQHCGGTGSSRDLNDAHFFLLSFCVPCFLISKLSCSCVRLQSLVSSPPYAAFSIAYSSPKHQSKPLSRMQKGLLVTDILRSCGTVDLLSLRSPLML